MVGPAFDVIFLANCVWPILVLLVVLTAQALPEGGSITNPIMTFWIYYCLTLPHRWITLGMVFMDGDRFWQRPGAYTAIALTFLLLIAAMWLSTETLVLLLLVDYVWNAWHFASQHSGISRIYGRTARPELQTGGLVEKVALRVFILYAIFRPLVYPVFESEEVSTWPDWVQRAHAAFLDGLVGIVQTIQGLDLVMLAVPVVLLLNEVRLFRGPALGRLVYLGSVCLLYGSLILGMHLGIDSRIILGLLLATAVYHATEYLAIVSWSVWKKHGRTPGTLLGHLVPRWGMTMVTFVAVLGLSGWMMSRHFLQFWLLVTVFVSYLHYAYDGMIWKFRRPASAAVA